MRGERELRELVARVDGAGDPLRLFEEVSVRLRRLVRFDAAAWSTTDPETALVTAPTLTENLDGGRDCFAFWECELLEESVNAFRELARAATPAAGLRATTGDLPGRSPQYRKLISRRGLGDELRAVLRVGGGVWGVVSLFRERGRPPFDDSDIAFVADLSEPLARRLRAFARPVSRPVPVAETGPGLVLLDEAGTAISINEEARHHLARVVPGPSVPSALGMRLPVWVVATAAQARAIARERDRRAARIRVRTVSGHWLLCHASCLTGPAGAPGPTAVVIEPAPAGDIATIIARAYELSPRELEVTQLVARGLDTAEIAAELFVSPHTVRGHVKAVFQKVRVSSRGELVARLFTEHYWPRRIADVTAGGPASAAG